MKSGTDLAATELFAGLGDPVLESMNFLNQIAERYPEAVSFAAGRPTEAFFDVGSITRYLDRYHAYLRDERSMSPARISRALFQYGNTKGLINDLIATHLSTDEDIRADPESVVVTVGCQEAMLLVLRAFRRDERDVALAVSPTYVGLTGAARLVDMPVVPVAGGPDGIDLDVLAETIRRVRQEGRRPRLCYVMPDFANPSGLSIDVSVRRRLLDLAAAEDVLLLEDNPYGLFNDGGPRPPTLKALDRNRTVIYLGSFAKTVFPGARVGYVVADQRVATADGFSVRLADELAKVKSMVTVNTSPFTQAMIGGALLENEFSLARANRREHDLYRSNLAEVGSGLRARLERAGLSGLVQVNAPSGGFFLVVTLPVPVGNEMLEHSARTHQVIWTPMAHFYESSEPTRELRLSISTLTPQTIEQGLDRLVRMIGEQVSARVAVA
ncbi:aminotransferase-like domain-containing protein [Actinoplanes aureus]|uniref:PLP-dependent aminotransferase family protein n=1 Tax=Actinoplanes aureus TaxID=2792083 RepID=A0A931CHN7_9ACTN|nr:PLP-dependent aminotransferase family protein [Actinoplanes aureus]MBG0567787.1 PLP-dependent aminotransferase family protein [Actinoplanes aureus]